MITCELSGVCVARLLNVSLSGCVSKVTIKIKRIKE